jgi:hypothetical protein
MLRVKDLYNISEADEASDGSLANKIKSIILTYFDLDDNGNPTIPTQNDLGNLDEIEYSAEVVDRIWELIR